MPYLNPLPKGEEEKLFQHRTPNIEHRTFNAQRPTPNAQRSTLNAEHRTPNGDSREGRWNAISERVANYTRLRRQVLASSSERPIHLMPPSIYRRLGIQANHTRQGRQVLASSSPPSPRLRRARGEADPPRAAFHFTAAWESRLIMGGCAAKFSIALGEADPPHVAQRRGYRASALSAVNSLIERILWPARKNFGATACSLRRISWRIPRVSAVAARSAWSGLPPTRE